MDLVPFQATASELVKQNLQALHLALERVLDEEKRSFSPFEANIRQVAL